MIGGDFIDYFRDYCATPYIIRLSYGRTQDKA